MINWNKISNTTKTDFAQFYNKLTFPHPNISEFLKLPFEFTLGIYLLYIQSKSFIVIISTHGYKLRQYPVDEIIWLLNVQYETPISPIESYKLAIQASLEYIDNPF